MIHEDIINRYDRMLTTLTGEVRCDPEPGTEPHHLRWMLSELRAMTGEKAHRWLGFVQGCLIWHGLADVKTERDFTRPYFTLTTTLPATNRQGYHKRRQHDQDNIRPAERLAVWIPQGLSTA